ncbi:helix-turn-helix domain-containing protein [Enterococcus faecalis]|uniref:helix-turn-helix domain-containing protein n=1 Tax=Enterococcus faecalis TaxID=1351 RepID=UPI002DB61738|nr:helix-turn-helix domain-containing protein [Enterococcus faecalis]MEB7792129.1 helix-turn-helix domain-containing protein [Enterococcus faecalis]MEB7810084.1 helix-turn-helix domain-containing protein [Enterococcus faecalis]
MDYTHFLEKKNQLKIRLLKEIIFSSTSCSKQYLQNCLNISTQTLCVYLDELPDDFEKIGVTSFKIIETEESFSIEKPSTINLKQLLYLFLKESYKYQILVLFLNKGKVSYTEIEESLNMSRSTIYRKLVELNTCLKEFDIQINDGRLEGSELQIRYFYFQLIVELIPFENLISYMNNDYFLNILNDFEKKMNTNFSIVGKTKMYIWMDITLRRYNSECEFDFSFVKNLCISVMNSELYQSIEKILFDIEKKYKFKRTDEDRICMFIISLCCGFFPEFYSDYLKWNQNAVIKNIAIQDISNFIQDFLENHFPTSGLKVSEYRMICFLLFQSIIQLICFKGHIFSYDEEHFNFLMEYQPVQSLKDNSKCFVKQFFANWESDTFDIDSPIHRNFYYRVSVIFRYISTLTDTPVKIGLRCSADISIQLLLEQIIDKYLTENIAIDVQIYEETKTYDLILSDYILPEDSGLKNIYILSELNTHYDNLKIKEKVKDIYNEHLANHFTDKKR